MNNPHRQGCDASFKKTDTFGISFLKGQVLALRSVSKASDLRRKMLHLKSHGKDRQTTTLLNIHAMKCNSQQIADLSKKIIEDIFSDQITLEDYRKASKLIEASLKMILTLPTAQLKSTLSKSQSEITEECRWKEVIYTDGACSGNPGPGGYGIVIITNDNEDHPSRFQRGYRRTTNNRMELMAVINALSLPRTKPFDITIVTDSKYVVDAINKGWLESWHAKDYLKTANSDLWKELHRIMTSMKDKGFNISFEWIKGHNGNKWNEMADRLAVEACSLQVDEQFIDNVYETNKN